MKRLATLGVRSTLPEETSYRCLIDYLGAYAVWDMPSGSIGPQPRDLEAIEDVAQDDDELPVVDRENDPPIIDICT